MTKTRKITAIEAQVKNKERVKVYLDGEFYKGISLETVVKHRLKTGAELTEEDIARIFMDDEKTRALEKAAGYVAKSLKTKRQVKDYLVKKGFSDELAWECVDKLKEYGYIDDEEYAKRFIESTAKTQGLKLMQYKLMQKGVRKEDIFAGAEKAEAAFGDSAARLAEKYMRNKDPIKENYAKLYRYLIGKGFSYEEADFAVKSVKGDED